MKLSIITINYNNADGLRKTMDSVFAQTYRDFEYIVIDGASTDGSVDVIKEFAACPVTHNLSPITFTWISEPDNGIYDAMNKGIEIASGLRVVDALNRSKHSEDKNKELPEYVLMLNSGDYLVDEHVIERIIPELHNDDIIQGNVIEEIAGKYIRNRGYGRSNISFIDALGGYILHQAAFVKLNTLAAYGYYDESYKKNADTYFFIKALALGNASFRYVDIDIANFDTNGISNNPQWNELGKQENAKWYSEHISKRMVELYRATPIKIRIYDTLHRNKIIWFFTMILVHIAEWIYPTVPDIKKEKIN